MEDSYKISKLGTPEEIADSGWESEEIAALQDATATVLRIMRMLPPKIALSVLASAAVRCIEQGANPGREMVVCERFCSGIKEGVLMAGLDASKPAA